MLAKNANVKYRIDLNALEVGKDKDDTMGDKSDKKKKNNERDKDKDDEEIVDLEPRRSIRNKSIPSKYNTGD